MSTNGKAQVVCGSCFQQMPKMTRLFNGSKKSTAHTTSSSLRFKDKVAVITGGANGIGAATARLFVSHGAKVIIADTDAAAGIWLSSELGSSAHFFRCDVTKEESVAAAVDYAVSSWGHLDIMFHNAGVAAPLVGLANVAMEDFDQVMAVHIKGAVLGVKHAARVMIPAGKGVILCSGSTSAVIGDAGPPLHSAANAAVLCIVRSAAAELARHGIRVNAVSPQCAPNPMRAAAFEKSSNSKPDVTIEQFPKALAGTSELDVLTTDKVAQAVMFLASDEAGFISGNNLVVDGGFSVTKRSDPSSVKAAVHKSLAAEHKAEGRSPIRSLEGSSSNNKLPSKVSAAKERELEDKVRVEREKSEEKVSRKGLGETQKEKQREEKERHKKEREKRQQERQIEQDKPRAKQEKQLAKEEKARAEDSLKTPAKELNVPSKDQKATAVKDSRPHLNGNTHPVAKKTTGNDESFRKENVELLNAGPKPDVPLEIHPNPPEKKINSLLFWGRSSSKKDPGQIPKRESQHADRLKEKKKVKKKVRFSEADDLNSKNEKNQDKLNLTAKDSKQEKKEDKPRNPGKVEKKEAKAERARSDGRSVSPIEAASTEIASERQPKPSPLKRIGSLLRTNRTRDTDTAPNAATDPGRALAQETRKASKKQAGAEESEAGVKDSRETAASRSRKFLRTVTEGMFDIEDT